MMWYISRMPYKLSDRSLSRLDGVHPDLVAVVKEAINITEVDFGVLEGLRTKERQLEMLRTGASTTKNSRHITGHAVDLGAYVGGVINWKPAVYKPIAWAMKTAAADLNIPIAWGGDWLTFKDYVHFELTRKAYPA